LVDFVVSNTRIPIIKNDRGLCHTYVDEDVDLDMAARVVANAKTQRPGVCNALECLLVHQSEARTVLPAVEAMAKEKGVELRGCPRTVAVIPSALQAEPSDYGREFLDKILAIRVVSDIDDALAHVAKYGSGHTEAICTRGYDSAQRWLREVDASCVLVNASTRFNDGGELGLGAEIGISTSKLHAFGPMGAASLTTKKWIVYGDGQVRG
jgi:glutamate-5-semialdehyde dehydrogenase